MQIPSRVIQSVTNLKACFEKDQGSHTSQIQSNVKNSKMSQLVGPLKRVFILNGDM